VNAALPNSLIEIQDNGPYSEAVTIPPEKIGLTVRGKKGLWPILISMEPNSVLGPLVTIAGTRNNPEASNLA